MLIHVGINTVELNGAHYTAHVASGEPVKKGQLLLEFDIPAIEKAGYDITTPVIVTNTDDYKALHLEKVGAVNVEEKIMVVEK